MTELLITGGIGLVSTIVSGWVSWIFARKKYNTEVDSNYIDNLQKAFNTYDSIIAHNKAEIEHLMKRNDDLEKEVSELRKQMLDLTMNICLDLACSHRVREQIRRKKSIDKAQERLNETDKINNNEEIQAR